MVKRLLAGPLWFLVVMTGYALVAALLGAPVELGPILGLVVGTLVVLDPGGLIWPAPGASDRRVPYRSAYGSQPSLAGSVTSQAVVPPGSLPLERAD